MNYYCHIDRSKVQFDFLVDEDSTRVPEEEIIALGDRVFRILPYQHPIRFRIAHSHSIMGKGEFAKNAMKLVLRPFANVYPTVRFACSRYAGKWLFGKNADFYRDS